MATSSPLSLPSSFDPALHLHSEGTEGIILPPSYSNSDDLEALHEQNQESLAQNTKQGVVIQHRAWRLNDALRSDEIFSPETPSRSYDQSNDLFQKSSRFTESDTAEGIMPFSSSPVHYPPSSSPPIALKRKRHGLAQPSPKKRKIVSGFIDEEDDDDDDAISDSEDKSLLGPQDVAKAPASRQCLDPIKESRTPEPEAERVSPESRPKSRQREMQANLSGIELLRAGRDKARVITSSGKHINIPRREAASRQTLESVIGARSITAPGKAKQSYYGIDIHKLIDEAKVDIKSDATIRDAEDQQRGLSSVEPQTESSLGIKNGMTKLWTEKYRAKRFTELVGDERTHRQVLKWLKGWDPIVFPGTEAPRLKRKPFENHDAAEERQMRKILMLTGPPGLGKTTLAHVCAKQAGYEVLEINASDERSRDVVRGRIKDALGTENVRGVNTSVDDKSVRKAGKPVCVVVDEVDGVVSGSGGSGEGGFIKALIDLVQLDQKNANRGAENATQRNHKRKGDNFRLLRPLILICNDVYHPSLRPLRATSIAEIVHVRKPPLDKVIARLQAVLDKEGIESDKDGVRRLCEAAWGIASRKQGQANTRGSGEGDIRGILVAGEWAAHKLRSTGKTSKARLTRKWIEEHILASGSADASRGLGRGGVREVVGRVFLEGAGLPNVPNASELSVSPETSGVSVLGVADIRRRAAMKSLREMLDTTGDHDRCVTDCFSTYPTQVYQDDTFLSKPNVAYDWLHFHDSLSSRVFGSQEWELIPYLSQATLAFHHLFAAVGRNAWDGDRAVDKEEAAEEESHPFSGPKADFAAHEALKQNHAVLSEFQGSFAPPLMRLFRSLGSVATELVPNLVKMTAPDIKPVVVGGSTGSTASVRKESEKQCVALGARAMHGVGVKFDKARVEFDGPHGQGAWVYRMEPPLDEVTTFHMGKSNGGPPAPVRYAIRQVLDQELRKEVLRKRSDAKQSRSPQGFADDIPAPGEEDKENAGQEIGERKGPSASTVAVRRDFFGRIVNEAKPTGKAIEVGKALVLGASSADEKRVWVSFHEGYSNAVRKPITLRELMDGFV